MSRHVLPHGQGAEGSRGFLWCMAAPVLPSIGIALAWRPFTTEPIGLMLGSVITGGFICWTGSNLISGVVTSKQGVCRRDEAPIRYWVHSIAIAAATFLVLLFWLHQIGVVAAGLAEPGADKPLVATGDHIPLESELPFRRCLSETFG